MEKPDSEILLLGALFVILALGFYFRIDNKLTRIEGKVYELQKTSSQPSQSKAASH